MDAGTGEHSCCAPTVMWFPYAPNVSTLPVKNSQHPSNLNAHLASYNGTARRYMSVNTWTMTLFDYFWSSHIFFVASLLSEKSGQKSAPTLLPLYLSVWKGWVASPPSSFTTISTTGTKETSFTLTSISILMTFPTTILTADSTKCLTHSKVAYKSMFICISSFLILTSLHWDGHNLW